MVNEGNFRWSKISRQIWRRYNFATKFLKKEEEEEEEEEEEKEEAKITQEPKANKVNCVHSYITEVKLQPELLIIYVRSYLQVLHHFINLLLTSALQKAVIVLVCEYQVGVVSISLPSGLTCLWDNLPHNHHFHLWTGECISRVSFYVVLREYHRIALSINFSSPRTKDRAIFTLLSLPLHAMHWACRWLLKKFHLLNL